MSLPTPNQQDQAQPTLTLSDPSDLTAQLQNLMSPPWKLADKLLILA